MVDQSQRKAAEEEVRYLAYNDPLTGLPNRRLLLDRLEQALAMSARHQLCGAVMMLDLDNFKTINETQGPDMGDRLLREVTCLWTGGPGGGGGVRTAKRQRLSSSACLVPRELVPASFHFA